MKKKAPVNETTIAINSESDIVVARRAARDIAAQLGFGSADQTRLATAISELARNVIRYANTGSCIITEESAGATIRLRVVVEDYGPGIPDIDKAMEDGFSTGGGLGAGLPGARRLVHDFSLESEPGHTRATVAMNRRII